MFIFYIDFLIIRPWSYNRETPFPEYKTMVFNLVPKLSTHEGHFSNIRPGLINGKNRYTRVTIKQQSAGEGTTEKKWGQKVTGYNLN